MTGRPTNGSPADPHAGPTVRRPAVAGAFYPATPAGLTRSLDTLLDDAPAAPSDEPLSPAYVVPHAGYRFSGPTAAHVYRRLRRHAADIRRVLLIGPSHFVGLRGAAVPTVDRWSTPLGDLALDTATRDDLTAAGLAAADDEPHRKEHSLEVQIPFLQRVLPPTVTVLPIAVGITDTARTADLLTHLAPDPATGTILLCSTDLSHYHDEPTAQAQDRRTTEAVLDRDPTRIGTRDACGVFALRGLVALAARRDWHPRLLHLATSADTAGTPDRVVGYSAFAVDQSS